MAKKSINEQYDIFLPWIGSTRKALERMRGSLYRSEQRYKLVVDSQIAMSRRLDELERQVKELRNAAQKQS